MFPNQQILRIPGPTPIPPSVQRALIQPMIGHRDQSTKNLLQRIQPKLKSIFGTKSNVAIVAGSGTAGLEIAVTNIVHPNDEVLVIVTGAFGERFVDICNAHQIKVHRLDTTWGDAISHEQVQIYLQQHPAIKAVFATYCETSTGVLNPVQAIASIVKQHSEALFIVDGVSCIGGVDMQLDDWGIDICVTGSQKAMMLPPGLTLIAVSDRAWQAIEQNKRPRFYFDLLKYRDQLLKDSTPFTPAVSLLFGLEAVLDLFEAEGFKQIVNRHQQMMQMTRAAINALNLPLLAADTYASPTVTSIKATNFSADDLRAILKQEFGLIIAGGPKHLKDNVFRIGHMGYCSPADVLQYISLLEIGLKKINHQIELGSGVKAAQEIYLG